MMIINLSLFCVIEYWNLTGAIFLHLYCSFLSMYKIPVILENYSQLFSWSSFTSSHKYFTGLVKCVATSDTPCVRSLYRARSWAPAASSITGQVQQVNSVHLTFLYVLNILKKKNLLRFSLHFQILSLSGDDHRHDPSVHFPPLPLFDRRSSGKSESHKHLNNDVKKQLLSFENHNSSNRVRGQIIWTWWQCTCEIIQLFFSRI